MGGGGADGRGLAVVIGAGPGLGRSLALNFARHGLDVGMVARDGDRLARIADVLWDVHAAGGGPVEVVLGP